MADLRNSKCQLRVDCPDAVTDIDVLETVQSQYAASPRLMALLVKKAALADPGRDLMLFYESIFNPRTAEGVGLDIWARIVGASGRTVNIESAEWFGFRSAALEPFGQAPFWRGREYSFEPEFLSDASLHSIIFWKAAGNIGNATAAGLNQTLKNLFPDQTAYVLETGVMQIRVVAEFELTEEQAALFRAYGLLGKGAGVGVEWLSVETPVFGFAEAEMSPFGQAPFFGGEIELYQPY